MAEPLVITKGKEYIQPPLQHAALEVFTGVYNTFATEAKNSPTHRQTFENGQAGTIEVNPALEFVQERFQDAADRITPLAASPLRREDLHARLVGDAAKPAAQDYGDDPIAIAGRLKRVSEVADSFL